jgi:hypothetical protein
MSTHEIAAGPDHDLDTCQNIRVQFNITKIRKSLSAARPRLSCYGMHCPFAAPEHSLWKIVLSPEYMASGTE